MGRVLNTINSNMKRPGFESNVQNFKDLKQSEEERLYKARRHALEQMPSTMTPSNDWNLRDTSGMFHIEDFERNLKTLERVNTLLSKESKGGTIVTYDMETVGGVSAIDYNMMLTEHEKRMLSITELAVQKNYVEAGGRILDESDSQVFSWGISKTQEKEYIKFFDEIRGKSWEEINNSQSYRSTLERLGRYRGKFEDVFRTVNDGKGGLRYELIEIGDSVIDIEAAWEGFQNNLRVGRHQGFDTKYGQAMYEEVKTIMDQATIVAGYNNHRFDDRIFAEIEALNPKLPHIEIDKNKSYDGLAVKRLANQGSEVMAVHQIASNNGIHLFDTTGAAKLETTAKAAGLPIDAHQASSDVGATFELSFKQKIYGTEKETLPEYGINQIKANLMKMEETQITSANKDKKVLFVNKALKASATGSDYMTVGGEVVTFHDWYLPRGEAFKVDDYRFISKDELFNTMKADVAQSILDGAGAKDGVYSLKLKGASQLNEETAVRFIRGTQEEIQELMTNNLTVKTLVKNNKAINASPSSAVTQTMVDQAVKVAKADRARRDFLSYMQGNGNYGYEDAKKMYTLFETMEAEFKTHGLTSNVGNLRGFLDGDIPEMNPNKIFSNNGINFTKSRRDSFENLYGIFKSSNQAMGQIFEQIDNAITDQYVANKLGGALGAQGQVYADFLKQEALANIISEFELDTNSSNKTIRDVYSVMVPAMDSHGKIIENEYRELNFMTAKNGQDNIMSLIRGAGRGESDTIKKAEQLTALRTLTDDLSKRGLIPHQLKEIAYGETSPYMVAQAISDHIHRNINETLELIPGGANSLIGSSAAINGTVGDFLENLKFKHRDLSEESKRFARGFAESQVEKPMSRLNLSSFKVRRKNSDSQFKNLNNYAKHAPTSFNELIQQSIDHVKLAYGSFSSTAQNDFSKTESLLRRYHFEDREIDEIKNLLFGRSKVNRDDLSKNTNYSLVGFYDMNATFFEQDGKLYLGASKKENSRNFLKSIANNKSIDELKEMGLVIQMPTITEELGIRTIKQGSSHKVINERLHTYVDKTVKDADGRKPSLYLRTQRRSTVEEAISSWNIVQKRTMEFFHAGNLEAANKTINGAFLKPISNASGLTSRQTLVDPMTGRLKTGYVPNLNDLSTVNDIDASSLYSYLPFLYEKDKTVKAQIDRIATEQWGGPNAGEKFIGRMNEKLSKRQVLSLQGGTEVPIEEYFLKNLLQGDRLIEKIVQHGDGVLDERTINNFKYLLGTNASQILAEKRTQWGVINTNSPIEEVALGFFSDITRPSINAGRNTLVVDKERLTTKEVERLERIGVRPGQKIMTQEAFQKVEKFKELNPEFTRYESSFTGKFKAMSTHEGYAAIQGLKADDILAELVDSEGNLRFSKEDFNKVQEAMMSVMNTNEQRIVMHNALMTGSWADAEQTSFKAKGLSEAELDEIVESRRSIKKGDILGYREVNGEKVPIKYNKQTAGQIVSREGDMLFIQPHQRSVDGIKLSISGFEKGMGFAADLGDEADHLADLFDAMWGRAFGKDVAAIANPEMLKHGASAVMFGRYFTSSAEEVMGTGFEDMFLSILNKNLPGFNAQFQEASNGNRVLTHKGNPTGTGGYLQGLVDTLKEFEVLAQDEEAAHADTFRRILDRLEKEIANEEYDVTFARTTSSEQIPSNRVKAQMRGRQILGTETIEGFSYLEGGEYKKYADTLNKWEMDLVRQSAEHQEGARYIHSLNVTTQGAMGQADIMGMADDIVSLKFEELALPESNITAEQMQKTFFGVAGKDHPLDKYSAIKVDIGEFKIENPFTKEMVSEIYIPRAITHSVDGEVYLTGANKAAADLLTAIENLKKGRGDDSIELAQKAASEAYKHMFATFLTDYRDKDGVLRKNVLESRIEYSTRGLGSNIESPITQSMMEAFSRGEDVSDEVKRIVQALENGDTYVLNFYRQEAYKYAVREMEDGSKLLLDTVKVSKEQLMDAGIDFKVIGEQVLDESFWKEADQYQAFLSKIKDPKDLEAVGELYARTEGIMGIYGRDPYFHSKSRRVAKFYLDDEIKGKSFGIFGWMATALEQDTDGDNTNAIFFLKRNKDGKASLFKQTDILMEHAEKVRDAQAVQNTKVHILDALDHYDLSSKKTGRVSEVGQDIELMIQELINGETAEILGGVLQDNSYRNEAMMMRAIKNRHGKMAIGHLSVPNYSIREAREKVLRQPGYEAMYEAIGHVTQVAEQKLISIKHIKGKADDVTGVLLYARGVRELMRAESVEEQVSAMENIITSFRGPIFSKDLELDTKAIVNGTLELSGYEASDQKVIEGLQAISFLSRDERAREIYRSEYIKDRMGNDDKAIEVLKAGVESHGSAHLEAVKEFSPQGNKVILDFGEAGRVGELGENVLTHDGSTYQMGVYRPIEQGQTASGTHYTTLRSEDSTIKVFGRSEEEMMAQLQRQFNVAKEGETGDLAQAFVDQFMASSANSYQDFTDNKIMATALSETLYKNGNFDIMEFEENVTKQLSNGHYAMDVSAELQATERIMKRVASYTEAERMLIGSQAAAFTNEAGQAIEEFGALTQYLVDQNQINAVKGNAMLKQLNDEIRRKAADPQNARAEAMVAHMPSASYYNTATLNQMTETAMSETKPYRTSGLSPVELSERTTSLYPTYDMSASQEALKVRANALEADLVAQGHQEDLVNQVIKEDFLTAAIEDITESNAAQLHQRLTNYEQVYAEQGRSALGWMDDSILHRLSNTTSGDMIRELENSTVIGGDFTGRVIGDLSVEDLHNYISESYQSSNLSDLHQQSLRHVETYLNAVESSASQSAKEAMERASVAAGQAYNGSKMQITVNELNDSIRQRASQATRQLEDTPVVNSSIGQMVKSLPMSSKIGIGLSIGAAAMMTGMQYTANQSALKATRQAQEEQEATMPRQNKHVAPASGYNGATSYLNQNVSYNIHAKANARKDMKNVNESISRITGSASMRIVNVDNREEISDKWLQERIIDVL